MNSLLSREAFKWRELRRTFYPRLHVRRNRTQTAFNVLRPPIFRLPIVDVDGHTKKRPTPRTAEPPASPCCFRALLLISRVFFLKSHRKI